VLGFSGKILRNVWRFGVYDWGFMI